MLQNLSSSNGQKLTLLLGTQYFWCGAGSVVEMLPKSDRLGDCSVIEPYPCPMPELTLTEILDCQHEGDVLPSISSLADDALLKKNYEEAVRLYAEEAATSPAARAKHGFSAAMVGDDTSAENLLDIDNVGTHPLGMAILAWVLAGPRGKRIDTFFSAKEDAAFKHRRETVFSLLNRALAVESPPPLVFLAACDIHGAHGTEAKALVVRARSLYPNWAWAQGAYAATQRTVECFPPAILNDLMRVLPSAIHAEVFREAFIYAMKLQRWGDAERVIEVLEALVREDRLSNWTIATLDEMRTMVALHRARAGDVEAYEDALKIISPHAGMSSGAEDDPDPLNAPRFMLDIALETHNEVNVRDAVRAVLEQMWGAKDIPGMGLGAWTPALASSRLNGWLHIYHFGFGFVESWQRALPMLDEQLAARWSLLVAADAVLAEHANEEELSVVREADLSEAPLWALRAAFQAFCVEPVDFRRAGKVLAWASENNETLAKADDDLGSNFYLDDYDSEPIVEIFRGAFGWLMETPAATGIGLLRCWGQSIIENDGASVVEQIAQLSLSRQESEVARKTLEAAQQALVRRGVEEEIDLTPQATLKRWLDGYPDPKHTQVRPEELTLLEAAALIALFRASPLNHSEWTLAALRNSTRQFEPTKKFIEVMFSLMRKGVIAVHGSTPQGTLWVQDDKLIAYLDQVVWRVSPHTLELHRGIRDLALRDWPKFWRSHAAILARDLGVEEMVTYQEHLLTERDLPVPDGDAVREIYRVQLERLSIAQCYYLTHKSMRETLDYQARYRPGQKQLQARMLNLLRGNGEKAVEKGWDTRYERVRDLPVSLLHESLHDVLTRWGDKAFEEPVLSLMLDESEAIPDAS